LRRIGVFLATLLTAACSEAKFSSLVSRGGSDAVVAESATCGFLRLPHPDTDRMVFDVTVPGPGVVLDMAGLRDRKPENAGQQYVYVGVNLPVGSGGQVSARVSSGAVSGSCEAFVTPIVSTVSPMRFLETSEGSGVAEFTWKWSGLYAGEFMSFDAVRSVLSPDLSIGCVGSTAKAPDNAKNGEQEFVCKVSYKTNSLARSVRYKTQSFAWTLKIDEGSDVAMASPASRLFDRDVTRSINIDLVKGNPMDPAPQEIRDPEDCSAIKGQPGFPFSHVCAAGQSLSGGMVGGPGPCAVVDPAKCGP
jgi:hypothetical protein